MKRFREFFYNLHPYALCYISGPLTVAQIVLAFVLRRPGIEALRWVGFIVWWIAAIFGWLPIFVLRSKGSVTRGDSYVKTTKLVDTGIYSIVRHPQMGTAWLLMCIAMMLMAQHWSSVALAVPAMVLAYLDLLKADQRLVGKFGDAYRRYMERVPRVNFLLGIVRILQQAGGRIA
jgi:protein-S-isoprenylcysteine O-methyltransferase Ste14